MVFVALQLVYTVLPARSRQNDILAMGIDRRIITAQHAADRS
jgi:hypothetical protein